MDESSATLTAVLRERRVIPRWRSPNMAVERVPMAGKGAPIAGEFWVDRLRASFEENPDPHLANDLVETARLFGRLDAVPASAARLAAPIRRNIERRIATARLEDGPDLALSDDISAYAHRAHREIRRLRMSLSANSQQPLAWSELARNHLVTGEDEKALKAMQTALHLARRNRYLTRAATRLYVHIDEPDRAIALLRSNPATATDPWLMAAEIATTSVAETKSIHLDRARRLLASRTHAPRELSELAAAMGTIELMHGGIKKAKALFAQSLELPTENAVAQAQWAAERESRIAIPTSAWNVPLTYEAMALRSRAGRSWADALDACALWLADEPYSVRPAFMGSYIGFRPEHAAAAERFASAGLQSDPASGMLLNNRAVARAYLGKVTDGFDDVQKALDECGFNDPHLLATLGLIAFRSGLPDLGREYYGQSVAWFVQMKMRPAMASALLHWAREELRLDASMSASAKKVATAVARSGLTRGEPELLGMVDLILELARAEVPVEGRNLTRPDQPPPTAEALSAKAEQIAVPPGARDRAARFLADAERNIPPAASLPPPSPSIPLDWGFKP